MAVIASREQDSLPGAEVPRVRPVERYGLLVIIAVCLAVALYLRLWLLGHAGLNSDEAAVGLNALQIRHGHFSAFVWSQTYGGVEPYFVALMFAVFGSSPFVLNATPVLLAVVAAAVVWRIGVAILAAAVSTVVAVDVGYGGFSNVSGPSDWRANPNTAVTALSAKLQALGVRDVYAGYWVAYDLAFVSAGRIQVAPIVNDRDPGESKTVAGAARVGWVFIPAAHVGEVAGQVGSTTGLDPVVVDEQTLASWMTANGIRFRTATVGAFLLVLPDQNTWPQVLLGLTDRCVLASAGRRSLEQAAMIWPWGVWRARLPS